MKDDHLILNVYKCTSCKYRTTALEDFRVHVDTIHSSVRISVQKLKIPDKEENSIFFKCRMCEYKCKLRVQLQKHGRNAHKQVRVHSCKNCDFQTTMRQEYQIHVDTKHLSAQVNIKRHTLDAMSMKISCTQCAYQCKFNMQLKKHMQSHAQEKNTAPSKTINEDRNSGRIACNKCDYTCQFNIQLRKHVNKKHVEIKNTAQQFGCEKCAYKCDTGTTLRAHIEAYHIKDIFKCNYCGFEDETEDNLRMHVQSNHNSNQNIYYPCDECEVRTPRINDLVLHKKTVHGILKYACDLCEHSDTLLEGLWRHKVVDHQAFEPDTPEATYHMQQMLLISLSAQVEFLVNSMAKLNVQTAQGFLENKTHMDKLEGKLDTVDERVHDLDTALAKTTRFDNKIQNDSQAVLTKVSAKCAEIENLVLHVAKRKAVAESNPIRDEPGTEEHDGLKKKDTAEEKNDEIDKADDSFENKKHKITWVGTSLSKPLDKKKFEHDAEVNLTVKKAYCIRAEGRFKEANFTAIVPELVKKGGIDSMVLHLHRVY